MPALVSTVIRAPADHNSPLVNCNGLTEAPDQPVEQATAKLWKREPYPYSAKSREPNQADVRPIAGLKPYLACSPALAAHNNPRAAALEICAWNYLELALKSVSLTMQLVQRPMKYLRLIVLGWLALAASVASQGQDLRFSQKLSAAEQSQAGLERLSSDQLAVLDALVRQDEKFYPRYDAHGASNRLSQRLSVAERKNAGLELLTADELARLDALVAQHAAGRATGSTSKSNSKPFDPELERPAPEIHGMLTFTYGVGSRGYSEMGGSMLLSYDDPAHNFSLLVGYGEGRVKGAYGGRGCGENYYLRRPDGAPLVVH